MALMVLYRARLDQPSRRSFSFVCVRALTSTFLGLLACAIPRS